MMMVQMDVASFSHLMDQSTGTLFYFATLSTLIFERATLKLVLLFFLRVKKYCIMRLIGWLQTFVLLSILGCAESSETRQQKFLLKGNISLQEGNPEQASYYFKEALKINPCFVDALNNLGTVAFNGRHYEQAIARYDEALGCDPTYLPAYFNRANALYESKEYFRALSDLDFIQKKKPDTAAVYFTKGLVLTKMRKYPEALQAFEEAMKKDPQNKIECLVNQATVKFYMRSYQEAERELLEAEKLEGEEANIYNTLAMIQAETGRYEEALRNVNRALRVEADQPYFLNNRGYIFLGLHQLDSAEIDINRSMSIDPYNAWAYRNKGIFHLQKGDAVAAKRLLTQALSMDFFIDKIHFYLGEAYTASKEMPAACEQFRLSKELNEGMVTAQQEKMCKSL